MMRPEEKEPDLRTVGDIEPDALTTAEHNDAAAAKTLTFKLQTLWGAMTHPERQLWVLLAGSTGEYESQKGLPAAIHYDDWAKMSTATQNALEAVLAARGHRIILSNIDTALPGGHEMPKARAGRLLRELAKALGWSQQKVKDTRRAIEAKARKVGLQLP